MFFPSKFLPSLFMESSTTLKNKFISNVFQSNPLSYLWGQIRYVTYGQEYQPSSLRRKRKFGYLARMRTKSGRRIIYRRILKGRKILSA